MLLSTAIGIGAALSGAKVLENRNPPRILQTWEITAILTPADVAVEPSSGVDQVGTINTTYGGFHWVKKDVQDALNGSPEPVNAPVPGVRTLPPNFTIQSIGPGGHHEAISVQPLQTKKH